MSVEFGTEGTWLIETSLILIKPDLTNLYIYLSERSS